MGFRLVPKLVTLNYPEWRNGRYFCVILPNSAFLGTRRPTVCENSVVQRI